MTRKGTKDKFLNLIGKIEKLKKNSTQTRQKTGTFRADLESLRKSLDIGIDISSKNDRRITELVKLYGVEFGKFEK